MSESQWGTCIPQGLGGVWDTVAHPVRIRTRNGYRVAYMVNGVQCDDIQAAINEIEDSLMRSEQELRGSLKALEEMR